MLVADRSIVPTIIFFPFRAACRQIIITRVRGREGEAVILREVAASKHNGRATYACHLSTRIYVLLCVQATMCVCIHVAV